MTMRVLVYEPASYRGEVRELDGPELTASLDVMQGVVGGYIEAIYVPGNRELMCVVNEEGLLHGLSPNRCGASLGLVGAFFITRIDDQNFVSLTDDDERLVRSMFDLTDADGQELWPRDVDTRWVS